MLCRQCVWLTPVLCALTLAAIVSAVPARQAQPDNKPFTISAHSNLVLLEVSVKDNAGGYVTGLTRDHFQAWEDGHSRPITQFSSIDTPVTVGLVLDDSGSMRSKRRDVIMAGLAFAAASNPKDEFFVVNFNDGIHYGLPRDVPFTDNIGRLHAALNYEEAAGRTALYDAIASALQHLEASKQSYRTLIVVSDGGDNASQLKFPQLLQLVESSRATIYTIGLLDPNDHDLNPGVLKRMASVSGGEYFQPQDLDQIVPVFKKISSDIRNRYIVGYVPDEVADKHNIRTVRVQVTQDGHKLSVRSRTSYRLSSANDFVATAGPEGVSRE